MHAEAPKGGASTTTAPAVHRRTLREELAVRLRWLRHRAAIGLEALSGDLDHAAVLSEVESEGEFSGRYLFMVVMSSAIAILGLLLSSPAVVIGAMLISPLMGPIMLLGFSLCLVDYGQMRRALVSLAAGMAAALAISILIVTMSPLREATPEILARTRPNLFDLLVAIFSGFAGGYSVIRRKGATIVGVAIATALMPPITVVGFGIATGSATVAGGAFFLFMTNLLAIAFSVTGLAWLHGFATVHSEKWLKWQTGLVVAVFLGLSLPLGFALRDIAYETRVANVVRTHAMKPFLGLEAELSTLTVDFTKTRDPNVQLTVITHARVDGAEDTLKEVFATALKRPVGVRLNQIVVDESDTIDANTVVRLAQTSMAPLERRIEELGAREAFLSDLRAAVSFPTVAVEADPEAHRAAIVAERAAGLDLASYRTMETSLTQRFSGWTIVVVPPQGALPPILFDRNSSDLSGAATESVKTIAWALSRWRIDTAEVEGYASCLSGEARGGGLALSKTRAEKVAALLKDAGVKAGARSALSCAGQAAAEKADGTDAFQSARVRIAG